MPPEVGIKVDNFTDRFHSKSHRRRGLTQKSHPFCDIRRGSRGWALGRAPTPGTEGPAPKARVPSSQGQKEGTLVSLEWLFNTIQA